MFSYLKITIFVILASFSPIFCASAIDFDHDGLHDFVVIDINSKKMLQWYAVDINDATRRSLGEFGSLGNHLAVGNWSGDDTTSKGLVSQKNSGDFEWDIDLPKGRKKLLFGSYPAKAVSGLDLDNNGAIDPAVVSVGAKALEWTVLNNPGILSDPPLSQNNFGGKKALPFFANLDGTGDQIGYASVDKNGTLLIRSKKFNGGAVKSYKVTKFQGPLLAVLPVQSSSGNDFLFVLSKVGESLRFTILNGKKRVKKVTLRGDGDDAVVVGNYFGVDRQVVAVRKNTSQVVFIDTNGKVTSANISLAGILVDDININSFSNAKQPDDTPVPPPATPKTNPACSGVMTSTDHLLYKPVSDTSGNAVLVFDSIYKKEFQSVKIQLKDGSFEEGWWKGLQLWGNPDSIGPRQHWRTNRRHTEIADNALIIANDGTQECRFTIPGSSNRRWE